MLLAPHYKEKRVVVDASSSCERRWGRVMTESMPHEENRILTVKQKNGGAFWQWCSTQLSYGTSHVRWTKRKKILHTDGPPSCLTPIKKIYISPMERFYGMQCPKHSFPSVVGRHRTGCACLISSAPMGVNEGRTYQGDIGLNHCRENGTRHSQRIV